MRTFCCILLALFIAQEETLGFHVKPQGRIFNGNVAPKNAFPWMAGLKIQSPGGPQFCGGALIDPQFIVTSAYCVHRAIGVDVILGAHNVNDPTESGQVRMETRTIIVHPDFDPITLQNDIALVKLPKSVSYTESIQNIFLWGNDDHNWINYRLNITGWGEKFLNEGLSDELMYAEATGRQPQECIDNYGNYFNSDTNLCLGGLNTNSSMCIGDEGGPVSYHKNYPKIHLVAIASFAHSDSCKRQNEISSPYVYTYIYRYTEWMDQVMS